VTGGENDQKRGASRLEIPECIIQVERLLGGNASVVAGVEDDTPARNQQVGNGDITLPQDDLLKDDYLKKVSIEEGIFHRIIG
jgi:hypothetical protein